MLLFTGDIHGGIDIHKLGARRVPHYKELTKEDFVIICGDFGLVWDDCGEERFWLKWLEEKPFTTLFIDGNHENFDRLDALPVTEWKGGKVHRISPGIIHLMRGQAFNIDGRSIFTMGGAASHDKELRTEGVSWWSRELPEDEEYAEALRTLERHSWSFDFVVTHCAPTAVARQILAGMPCRPFEPDRLTDFLQEIEPRLSFRRWFCGHYHTDMTPAGHEDMRVMFQEVECW